MPEVTRANRQRIALAGVQAALDQLSRLLALFARGWLAPPAPRNGLVLLPVLPSLPPLSMCPSPERRSPAQPSVAAAPATRSTAP